MQSDGDKLARQLSTIEDLDLRARKAASLFASLPADFAVRALGEITRGAQRGIVSHAAAAEAALRALHGTLDEELRLQLREAALAAHDDDALALLSARPPARRFDSGDPGYVDREMTARTLGERKQLARSRDRDLLSRLAHDQDPVVVRQLLENPRVTEREVLIAASRRPTHVAVLEEIFRSRRFGRNRRVRKALALNPYSPPALAAAALSILTAPELREVMQERRLAAELRAHAARQLELRGRKNE